MHKNEPCVRPPKMKLIDLTCHHGQNDKFLVINPGGQWKSSSARALSNLPIFQDDTERERERKWWNYRSQRSLCRTKSFFLQHCCALYFFPMLMIPKVDAGKKLAAISSSSSSCTASPWKSLQFDNQTFFPPLLLTIVSQTKRPCHPYSIILPTI